MEKQFNVNCLTSNGIRVNSKPNVAKKSVNLDFGSGDVYKLSEAINETKGEKFYSWDDESINAKTQEVQLAYFDEARGNPLLSQELVDSLSGIDAEIEEILNFYNGR